MSEPTITNPRPTPRPSRRAPQSLSGKAPAFTCPVCSEEVQASITVALEVGEPTLKANASATAPVPGQRMIDLAIGTKLTRYNVRHDCPGPIESPAEDGPAEEMGQ